MGFLHLFHLVLLDYGLEAATLDAIRTHISASYTNVRILYAIVFYIQTMELYMLLYIYANAVRTLYIMVVL